jgi:peptidyl-prolyl cis-trans isomerase D
MMQAFRNSAKLIAVFFGLMLLLWLVDLSGITGGSGVFQKTTVGRINGQRVETRQYEEAVQNAVQQRQQQSASPMTLEDQQSIRDQVWEQFIQNRILDQEMKRHDISVSTDEVVEAIRSTPPQQIMSDSLFQTDGRFDLEKYRQWLRSTSGQAAIPYLEAQYTEQIKQAKLWSVVTADVFLSDAALWQHYRDEHEQVRVRLTAIVPRAVVPDSAVAVTPQEVDQYYQQHRDDFKRERTAFMSYVALPRTITPSDSAAALAKAQSLRQEIAAGTPFDEVARRESSDTVSGSRGGDLGEWTKGDFDPAFDAVAFTIPLNTLSQPVLTQFGYHIIEIASRTGNKAKGRHILVPIEVSGAHRDQLDAEADSLETLAADRIDPAALDTVGRALGLPVLHTGPVQLGTRVQVGRYVVPDAGVWAFQAQVGESGPVIEIPEAFFVFRLDSLQEAGVPPLAGIRASVELAVRDQKKWARAREIAKDAERRMSEGSTLTQVSDALKLPHQDLGPFTRLNPPLPNPRLVGAAFGVAKGNHSQAIDTEEGIYLIEVLDRISADSADFVKDIDNTRAQAIRLERQQRIRNYMTALRSEAQIKDYRAELFRTSAQAEAEAERVRQQTGQKGSTN